MARMETLEHISKEIVRVEQSPVQSYSDVFRQPPKMPGLTQGLCRSVFCFRCGGNTWRGIFQFWCGISLTHKRFKETQHFYVRRLWSVRKPFMPDPPPLPSWKKNQPWSEGTKPDPKLLWNSEAIAERFWTQESVPEKYWTAEALPNKFRMQESGSKLFRKSEDVPKLFWWWLARNQGEI